MQKTWLRSDPAIVHFSSPLIMGLFSRSKLAEPAPLVLACLGLIILIRGNRCLNVIWNQFLNYAGHALFENWLYVGLMTIFLLHLSVSRRFSSVSSRWFLKESTINEPRDCIAIVANAQ